MSDSPVFTISTHDEFPADAFAVVDQGLGDFNEAAAPLHEVKKLSCFARLPSGEVAGGALGRRWGPLCELQELWVREDLRRHGLGAQLVRTFEEQAIAHGCTLMELETFTFQAPRFYESLGYRIVSERRAYPHGIAKFYMTKALER